ncbi:uncharacterized protein LOC133832064 [Humulus lupulus]|uniref:uncharacterized protein LOC133832064 n=1 Tax=Humulus lupulus TaxID=3486 RepID=UPI002B4026D5|nr:uncharacterized protein LOC133832064 [Humulus lupulus]
MGESENGFHAIWRCRASIKFWKKTIFWKHIKQIKDEDSCLVLNNLRNVLKRDDFELFAIISWQIWYIRNKTIRGEVEPKPEALVEWCYNFWGKSVVQNGKKDGGKLDRTRVKWEPPPPGSVKINVDAGCLEEGRSWISAAVVRDDRGSFVGGQVSCQNQPLSALGAELVAVREGLCLGWQMGLKSFSVESDCSSAVSLSNRPLVFCNELEGVITDIKNLVEKSGCKEISFVGREANCLAHGLAKTTSWKGVTACSVGCVPSELFSVYKAELICSL